MTQANNQVQGSNILDVLKKKMRATKEESERFKEECDEFQRKLLNETQRREDVSELIHLICISISIGILNFSSSVSM